MFLQYRELYNGPRALWVIFALKFLESFAYSTMSYVLILYLSEQFHFSDKEAGFMFGIYGMLISLYGFFAGSLIIDRIGVRSSLMAGALLMGISRLLLATVNSNQVLLFVLFTFLPLGSCLGIPVLAIAIKRHTSEFTRPLAFSLFYVIMNAASLAAAPTIDFYRKYIHEEVLRVVGT